MDVEISVHTTFTNPPSNFFFSFLLCRTFVSLVWVWSGCSFYIVNSVSRSFRAAFLHERARSAFIRWVQWTQPIPKSYTNDFSSGSSSSVDDDDDDDDEPMIAQLIAHSHRFFAWTYLLNHILRAVRRQQLHLYNTILRSIQYESQGFLSTFLSPSFFPFFKCIA